MKELETLKEMYLDEIKRINKKGELTPTDSEAAKKALEAISMIDMICSDEEDMEDGYSERSYRMSRTYNLPSGRTSRHYPMPDMDYGYDDGRYSSRYSSRRGRGSNGRYVSRSGDAVEGMIRKLEHMKMDAPDEETRYAIDLTIEKLENY